MQHIVGHRHFFFTVQIMPTLAILELLNSRKKKRPEN